MSKRTPNRAERLLAVTEDAGYSPAEVAKAQNALAITSNPTGDVDIAGRGDPMQLVQAAQRALELANTVPDILQVRDMASAIGVYIRKRKLGIDAENEAAVIIIGAERRIGAELDRMAGAGERRRRGANIQRPTEVGGTATERAEGDNLPGLPELGISPKDAHHWRTLARLDDDQFAYVVDLKRTSGERLTRVDFYRLATQMKPRTDGNRPEAGHGVRDRDAEAEEEIAKLNAEGAARDAKYEAAWTSAFKRASKALMQLDMLAEAGVPKASARTPEQWRVIANEATVMTLSIGGFAAMAREYSDE